MSAHQLNQPRILFLATTDNVGMEHLLAAMVRHGATCAVLSPPGFFCTKTRFVSRCFTMPRHHGLWLGLPFVHDRLESAIRSWQPDLLVPLDENGSLLLRSILSSRLLSQRLYDLLVLSLGAPSGYPAACSRVLLMDVAAALPIRRPRYRVADNEAATVLAAKEWGYPVILKAEHTCGGHGVVAAHNAEELRTALAMMSRGGSLRRRCRSAGRDLVWGLAGITPSGSNPPILQEMITGVPAMHTAAAWQGHILEGASFVAERVHPTPMGTSTVVRHIEHQEMKEASRHLVRALGCSGFVSFDFILDPAGAAHLIEMNPRAIGTTHLGAMFGQDIVAALVARLQGAAASHVPTTEGLDCSVALFPKEMERALVMCDRLSFVGVLHDVPYDDPEVVAAYMQRLSRSRRGAAAGATWTNGPAPVVPGLVPTPAPLGMRTA